MIWFEANGRLPQLEHAQRWCLALPDKAAWEEQKVPLVLFLHDTGKDCMQLMRQCDLERMTDELGMAFLMPDGLHSCFTDMRYGPHWQRYLLEGLLPYVCEAFPVEKKALALGTGTGGWAAAHLREKAPKRFDGAVAVNGDKELPEHWAMGKNVGWNLAAVFGERKDPEVASFHLRDKEGTQWVEKAADETLTDTIMKALKRWKA